jgi:serine/threonine protein kinase
VFKAVHIFSEQYVAIKVIDKEDRNYVEVKSVVDNEILVLRNLPMSNNLIDFYEVESLNLTRKLKQRKGYTWSSNYSQGKKSFLL